MKVLSTIFLLTLSLSVFCQKDSLNIGDKYLEDQLYIGVTYNVLNNQPVGVSGSGFSYGLSGGYIKDIPLNSQGRFAVGIGLGYNFDSFNHGYKMSRINNEVSFEMSTTQLSNKMKLNNIEIPIELRFRTSTAKNYTFWRVYAGVKLNYNLSNSFTYITDEGITLTFNDVSRYNKFQTGLTLSTGYGAFNLYGYYGLTPMFKSATTGINQISTRIMRFGLIFYIL